MTAKEIRELIDLMKDTAVIELELERGGVRVRIKMGQPPSPSLFRGGPSPQVRSAEKGEIPQVTLSAEEAGKVVVTSPMVGIFRRAPSPDADPYVEIGDLVHKGQVLCIIEAMKLMNEIQAEVDGKIAEIMVENAHPVEYGTPLFLIDSLSPT